ncbi:MAG: chemotaxis protein CheW [candidate division WOR-3 bacterium]
MRYLIFNLGNKTLALPGDRVIEIVRLLLLGPSPGKAYMGSVSWHDKTLAVLEPGKLGIREASPGFAIVTYIRGVPVGFPADRATGFLEIDELDEAPPGSDEWLAGVIGQQRVWAIEPDRVITLTETGEAARLIGEDEFLIFCAKALSEISERRKSKELERAAKALSRELEKEK